MSKIKTVFCLQIIIIIALMFTASASNEPDNGIWIDFSEYSGSSGGLTSKIYGNGIDISPGGDGERPSIDKYGNPETWCVKAGDFIYFYITDENIKECETVTMEVTFYDDATGGLRLEYCSSYPGDFEDGYHLFYPIGIDGGGTKQFASTMLTLERCNFTYGHNQGAQFRFSGNAAVQSVRITPGALPDPLEEQPPEFSPQTDANNIIGKGITGYQAWFHATPDSSGWTHWGYGNSRPVPGRTNVEMYPDVSEYEEAGAALYDTGLANLGGGGLSRLFSSKDEAVIDTHFKWMSEAGIDGAAVQRFFESTSPTSSTARNHLEIIRDKAEKYGRSFYIMYDMSASGRYEPEAMIKRLQLDFIYNVERKNLVSSPSYAHADGKPVVCLWGIHGVEGAENNRYPKIDDTVTLVNWFRERGYYIIAGVPDDEFYTRKGSGKDMFASFDMISPWYVGRDVNAITGTSGRMKKAMDFCDGNNIDFQPVVWAGFAWTNMSGNTGEPNAVPRKAGQFLWNQIYKYINQGAKSFYFAMFDEYDESTALMKAARDYFDVPTDQYFLTLAADGKWLSSDYYLRVTGACIEMIKGTSELRETVDLTHSEGPVYWRNSFERRDGRQKTGDGNKPTIREKPNLPLDVCVPNGAVIEAKTSGIETSGRINEMTKDGARSGESSFRLGGTINAANGCYYYKIADTEINVNSAMNLTYSLKSENELGRNVYVDLILDGDEYLNDILSGYASVAKGTAGEWIDVEINLPDIHGRKIIGVVIAYAGTASSGSFSALIDDISITADGFVGIQHLAEIIAEEEIVETESENQTESDEPTEIKTETEAKSNVNIIIICVTLICATITAGLLILNKINAKR